MKAWNATPWEAVADPVFGGEPIESFICGDDQAAKAVVSDLVRQTGFTVIDLGGMESAGLSENFAKLWGTIAYKAGVGRGFAFKIVRR